ncbi:MAG TPA: FeoA family protein [Gemmatales bacterium]|nr:FeoA family protein [Gemmatales bacterium]HMP60609.1 FeoA family protein [Gemmatales bacterium]
MSNLSGLKPGERGRISAVDGDDALSQRLVEMGLIEGDLVEVLALAPFGDPMEIRVGQSVLSLRRQEAARIGIEPLPPEPV